MTDKKKYWLDKKLLQELVEKYGSIPEVTKRMGGKPSTVYSAWTNHGLPSRKGNTTNSSLQELDVSDPDRIKGDQRDAELAHLRKEVKQLRKVLATRDAVVEQIVEAAKVPVKVPKYRVAKPNRALPIRSAVLPVFDCQFGQLVRPEDTPMGVGEFNTEVFDERLQRYLTAVTSSMRDYATSHRVTEVVIAFGGDLVEGEDIFAGQPWQLEHDPARQTIEFAKRWTAALADVLIPFLKEEIGVERIMIPAVPGNHGKVGGRKKGATPVTMSWDWLATEWLQSALRGQPIDLWAIEPGGMLMFETAGHTFLMIHGDEIRGWGGIPFYGLTRYDGRAMRLTGEVYDYCLLGHHHQPASVPNGSGGEFIVSGDWVGANNLSRFLVAGSRPQQRLLFVGAKYGITENIPIYLANKDTPKPHIYSTGEVVETAVERSAAQMHDLFPVDA